MARSIKSERPGRELELDRGAWRLWGLDGSWDNRQKEKRKPFIEVARERPSGSCANSLGPVLCSRTW